MKRYLIIMTCIVFAIAAVVFAYDQAYFPKRRATRVTFPFHVENTAIIEEKTNEPFLVKGVDVDSFVPGYYDTDHAVSKQKYMEWFEQIADMNANTVRAVRIYDPDFYNAFYEFNTQQIGKKESPLYLIQVVGVTDYAQNNARDAWSDEFYGSLVRNAKRCVDVVHGRQFLPYARTSGYGLYTRDISPWLLAYEIGSRWEADTIAYTDHKDDRTGAYEGEYIEVDGNATSFERLLGQVMDTLCQYETDKYAQQHLIAGTTQLNTDPFDFEPLYDQQIGKSASIDFSRFKAGPRLVSGLIIAYSYHDYGHDFSKDLTPDEQERLKGVLDQDNAGTGADPYLRLFEHYSTHPVILVNGGYSSSRGQTGLDGPYTEQEQGEALVRLYRKALASGLDGMVLTGWQDNRSRSDWNTSPYVEEGQQPFWHDLQSEGQGFGLLEFKPLGINGAIEIDGETQEWTKKEQILSCPVGKLSVQFDAEGVYMKIDWAKDVQFPVVIPIDVTPNSGARQIEGEPYTFDRDADFVLVLDSKKEAILRVQTYYESVRAAWNAQIRGSDAYSIQVPEPHEARFVPVESVAEEAIVDTAGHLTDFMPTVASGVLRCAKGADLYSMADVTELRLPWGLLNFSAPNQAAVHDDYYLHYGIESLPVENMYVGLGNADDPDIVMEKIKLPRWVRDFEYEERLKDSYAIVQDAWKEER